MNVNADPSPLALATTQTERKGDPTKAWSAALERAWVAEWPSQALAPDRSATLPQALAKPHVSSATAAPAAALQMPSAWLAEAAVASAAAPRAQTAAPLPPQADVMPVPPVRQLADHAATHPLLASAQRPAPREPSGRVSLALPTRAASMPTAPTTVGTHYGASWMSVAQPSAEFVQVNLRYRALSADREASVARTLAETLFRDGISQTRVYVNGHLYEPTPAPKGD